MDCLPGVGAAVLDRDEGDAMTTATEIFNACPTCGAAPMQECRDATRATMTDFHGDRREAGSR